MRKLLATTVLLSTLSTASFAVEACGPSISFGLDKGDSLTYEDTTEVGDTIGGLLDDTSEDTWEWNDLKGSTDGREDSLSLTLGIEWQLGWKKECEKANALERDAQIREIWAQEAELKASRAEATQTEIETTIAKLEFCLNTQLQYEELGRELPQSVMDLCGDLL